MGSKHVEHCPHRDKIAVLELPKVRVEGGGAVAFLAKAAQVERGPKMTTVAASVERTLTIRRRRFLCYSRTASDTRCQCITTGRLWT
jgi:hypothetical protein